MILLHPPPLPSSSSTPWPYDVLLFVNAQTSRTSSAASIGRFDTTEGRYGVTSSGTCRLSFSPLSLQHPMAPSIIYSPEMARSNKRASSYRSTVRVSDGNQSFDSTFRVSAFTRYGKRGVELELSDDDGPQRSKIKAPGKLKSAEELHFEAIEEYCLRYENEHIDHDCIVGVEADAPSLEDMHSPVLVHASTSYGDAVSTPINESKYLDASGVLQWHGDGGSLLTQSNGCKEQTLLQKSPSLENDLKRMPSKVPESVTTRNVNGTEGSKTIHMNIGNSQMTEAFQHKGSARKITGRKTVKDHSLDISQHQNQLDEAETLQIEKCHTQNKDSNSKVESANSDGLCDLSEEQKIRMELNKAAALGRRNMCICKDAVAEAQANGLPFPKFESLLIEKSWAEVVGAEFQKPYMERLHQFVSQEAAGRIPIYPPPAKLFNAFNSCPLDRVKVVIIGQDPYHGPGQAMGLCFSVEKGIKLPSSLTNIFLEIQSDLGCDFPSHGNLEKWAHQGVLLLNTVLTVRDHHANSHAKKGWELFTDAAIRTLAQKRSGVVFLLWGNQAQEKLRLINKTCHHILKAFHPSGISAHRGFFKCRHFSKTNHLLVDQGLLPIDWQL